ncbi:LysR family transcriptional regulator [Ramlibacter ginsenosidimutans]|uniref:LysR family transcriptional regulator n=1 Tax=Ramlibacter ginsenosidimutans TaxID=502333 RepID=A0A934TUJ7_9BURK|nr:LysR family transcriptional regulator [Ramlibacter ginsenosidimutans]MBK6007150.1 LysR family transcriptional regulator [Ramlibacter ginsenosidimutans]
MINLGDLRLLVGVAELGSIRAAAQQLGWDPSQATRRLAALEADLKVRLFARTTRKIGITEAGQQYVSWARTALEGFNGVQDAVGALKDEPRGIVRLACPELLAVRYVGQMARELAGIYPHLKLSIITTDRPVNLPQGDFDVAVYVGERPSSRLIMRKLLDVEMLLCASPDYLSECGEPMTPRDLEHHRLVSHGVYDQSAWYFLRRGKSDSVEVNWHVRTEGTLFAQTLALAGVGIARLTRRTAAADIQSGKLVHVLPSYKCVLSDGSALAAWVAFPHRQVLNRTRVVVDALVRHLQDNTAEKVAATEGRKGPPADSSP